MKQTKHILLALALIGGLLSCSRNPLPDLRETYKYKDTKPFGGYIAYHILQNSYPDKTVQVKNKAFSDVFSWISDSTALYVNLSKKFFVDEDDATSLLEYVYKGNTAFIAASEFDSGFMNKLYCKQDSARLFFELYNSYGNTQVELVPAVVAARDSTSAYYYKPFSNYFSKINDRYCRIVGYNEAHKANFIVFFWGKGRFYLHCDPRAFSNYFLLQKNNYEYMRQMMQALPEDPEHIYWDDYYNKVNYPSEKNKESGSVTGSLFSNPSMKAAFWITLCLLLLYILFNRKRRQRVIPVVKPVQNSSVAFAEAIAGVYLKEKNNRNIAEKMINFFNESVRSRYNLNTSIIHKEYLTALSKKAAVPLNTTENLYRTMQQVANMDTTSDQLLLDLNDQIQQFNKYNS